MQDPSVKRLFKEQLQHYAHTDQYKSSPLSALILAWLSKQKSNKRLEICEFGGGAGQLLAQIQKSFPKYSYTNMEIIHDYKQYLASGDIRFVFGSVLHSGFRNGSFDLIVMRDVLHHLVGRSLKEAGSNQILALKELKRVIRPGGVVFIEEFTNESEISGKLLYYLTRLNSKIGIHISSLFVSPNVIVSFLTSNKLIALCNSVFGKENVDIEIEHQEFIWHIWLLHLFGKLNKAIITIRRK